MGVLQLTDGEATFRDQLNDFLGPSQECTKPVTVKEEPKSDAELATKPEDIRGSAAVRLLPLDTPHPLLRPMASLPRLVMHWSDAFHDSILTQTEIQIDHSSGAYYEIDAIPSTSSLGLSKSSEKLKKAEITLNDCLACSGCVTSAESVLVALQSQDEVYKVLAERPVSVGGHSVYGFRADRLRHISRTLRRSSPYRRSLWRLSRHCTTSSPRHVCVDYAPSSAASSASVSSLTPPSPGTSRF